FRRSCDISATNFHVFGDNGTRAGWLEKHSQISRLSENYRGSVASAQSARNSLDSTPKLQQRSEYCLISMHPSRNSTGVNFAGFSVNFYRLDRPTIVRRAPTLPGQDRPSWDAPLCWNGSQSVKEGHLRLIGLCQDPVAIAKREAPHRHQHKGK